MFRVFIYILMIFLVCVPNLAEHDRILGLVMQRTREYNEENIKYRRESVNFMGHDIGRKYCEAILERPTDRSTVLR